MSKKHYDSYLRLNAEISIKPKNQFHFTRIKSRHPAYYILTELRNHKVHTDQNKLFGTRKSHKYY